MTFSKVGNWVNLMGSVSFCRVSRAINLGEGIKQICCEVGSVAEPFPK